MSPFDYLLLAHLIADFPLQTSWMANNKAKRWPPLLAHSALYTVIIEAASLIGFGGLSIWKLVIIFFAHILLDHRNFVTWWVNKIMRTDLTGNFWLGIMVDQVFHLTTLAILLLIK
jgi:hypothetical protein